VIKGNPREIYEEKIKHYKDELKNAKKIHTVTGIVPLDKPIKTFTDNILVCGDAGSLVHPWKGEGNCFAIISGILAARTAAGAIGKNDFSKKELKKYEITWKKEFGKELWWGYHYIKLLIFLNRLKLL